MRLHSHCMCLGFCISQGIHLPAAPEDMIDKRGSAWRGMSAREQEIHTALVLSFVHWGVNSVNPCLHRHQKHRLRANNTNCARRTRLPKQGRNTYSCGTCGLCYSSLEGLLIVLFLLPRYRDNLLQSAATHCNTLHQRLVLWLIV